MIVEIASHMAGALPYDNLRRLGLFAYKMTHDTGFAPILLGRFDAGYMQARYQGNPSEKGDWVAGFTSGSLWETLWVESV